MQNNMVYGGFEGFWSSYGRRQVYTSIWKAIFGHQKWSFSPYGQILKIRFSAIKYRILDFLSDSSRGRYPLSIPHMFRGGKKVKRCEFFDAEEKTPDPLVCGDSVMYNALKSHRGTEQTFSDNT